MLPTSLMPRSTRCPAGRLNQQNEVTTLTSGIDPDARARQKNGVPKARIAPNARRQNADRQNLQESHLPGARGVLRNSRVDRIRGARVQRSLRECLAAPTPPPGTLGTPSPVSSESKRSVAPPKIRRRSSWRLPGRHLCVIHTIELRDSLSNSDAQRPVACVLLCQVVNAPSVGLETPTPPPSHPSQHAGRPDRAIPIRTSNSEALPDARHRVACIGRCGGAQDEHIKGAGKELWKGSAGSLFQTCMPGIGKESGFCGAGPRLQCRHSCGILFLVFLYT